MGRQITLTEMISECEEEERSRGEDSPEREREGDREEVHGAKYCCQNILFQSQVDRVSFNASWDRNDESIYTAS